MVLVVDDEPSILRSIKTSLMRNYQIVTADSAKEALEILEKEKVQILLADDKMPGGSGGDLLASVKSTHPHIVRILFSGYTDFYSIRDAINKGSVFKFLPKPWEPDELKTTLLEAANYYQANYSNAHYDLLTGILASSTLTDILQTELKRCQRYKRNLSCVLFGIPDLEIINEVYGYSTRDLVLKEVSQVLSEEIRESDWIGRFGDKEFLILLPETDKAGVIVFLERCLVRLKSVSSQFQKDSIALGMLHSMFALNPQETISVRGVLQHLQNNQQLSF